MRWLLVHLSAWRSYCTGNILHLVRGCHQFSGGGSCDPGKSLSDMLHIEYALCCNRVHKALCHRVCSSLPFYLQVNSRLTWWFHKGFPVNVPHIRYSQPIHVGQWCLRVLNIQYSPENRVIEQLWQHYSGVISAIKVELAAVCNAWHEVRYYYTRIISTIKARRLHSGYWLITIGH